MTHDEIVTKVINGELLSEYNHANVITRKNNRDFLQFDCSGFVQYVYSRVGIYVSRSSYTQAYDGYGVSYSEAQPGDILNWGHGGQVTHSALYVGGGMMIHATNPSQGVVLSNVAAWESGSYDTLMGVRRIQ